MKDVAQIIHQEMELATQLLNVKTKVEPSVATVQQALVFAVCLQSIRLLTPSQKIAPTFKIPAFRQFIQIRLLSLTPSTSVHLVNASLFLSENYLSKNLFHHRCLPSST